jgi:hypothetical protein
MWAPFASGVRKPKSSGSLSNRSASFPRVPYQVVLMPAKTTRGLFSSKANYVGVVFGLASAPLEKFVHGTTQRFTPDQEYCLKRTTF